MIRSVMSAFESRAALSGVRRMVERNADGSWSFRRKVVPREVREMATEMLVAWGLPVIAESLLSPVDKETNPRSSQLAAVAILKDLGPGSARSAERDGEGEDLPPGVILLPIRNAKPVPPDDLEDVTIRDEASDPEARAAGLAGLLARDSLASGNGR